MPDNMLLNGTMISDLQENILEFKIKFSERPATQEESCQANFFPINVECHAAQHSSNSSPNSSFIALTLWSHNFAACRPQQVEVRRFNPLPR